MVSFRNSSSNPLRNFELASFLLSHPLSLPTVLVFISPSPFKVFLVRFGSVNLSFRCSITGLFESMRQNQSPANEKEAQDAISFDFEFEELIGLREMLKLALVPDLPCVPHARKQSRELLLGRKRKLFEPVFGRNDAIWSNVKLDSEDRAII